jgi:hypothetical protein
MGGLTVNVQLPTLFSTPLRRYGEASPSFHSRKDANPHHPEPGTMTTTTLTKPVVLTWDALIQAEPRLAELLRDVEAHRPQVTSSNLWQTWAMVKAQMVELVGWGRPDDHPQLGTSAAYDLCYRRLFDALTRGDGSRADRPRM